MLTYLIHVDWVELMQEMAVWVIVGATQGIGLEFVRQLLKRGDRVLATTRSATKASQLWALAGAASLGACRLLECDVTVESSIYVSRRDKGTGVVGGNLTMCRDSLVIYWL